VACVVFTVLTSELVVTMSQPMEVHAIALSNYYPPLIASTTGLVKKRRTF
jgi:hypothetical protein